MATLNSTPQDLGYGPRLSKADYEKAIVELHDGLPLRLTEGLSNDIQRRELNLAIDYRLGKNFPSNRRALLWGIQQRVEKQRYRLTLHWAVNLFLPKWLDKRTNKLTSYLVKQYSTVLSKEEMKVFFEENGNDTY